MKTKSPIPVNKLFSAALCPSLIVKISPDSDGAAAFTEDNLPLRLFPLCLVLQVAGQFPAVTLHFCRS